MVALGVTLAGSSRSPVQMDEMRALYEECAEMGVELRVEHVSSEVNAWAERLSREHDSTNETLLAGTFVYPDAGYGPHSFDRFASMQSARCPRFYPRWKCPGSLATNDFVHPWAGENCWSNPPFNQVRAAVRHALRSSESLTLIAHVWRAQLWWRRAVHVCSDWSILPPADGAFCHASLSGPTLWPFRETTVFRLKLTRV